MRLPSPAIPWMPERALQLGLLAELAEPADVMAAVGR
jgi:hypothetical protein